MTTTTCFQHEDDDIHKFLISRDIKIVTSAWFAQPNIECDTFRAFRHFDLRQLHVLGARRWSGRLGSVRVALDNSGYARVISGCSGYGRAALECSGAAHIVCQCK